MVCGEWCGVAFLGVVCVRSVVNMVLMVGWRGVIVMCVLDFAGEAFLFVLDGLRGGQKDDEEVPSETQQNTREEGKRQDTTSQKWKSIFSKEEKASSEKWKKLLLRSWTFFLGKQLFPVFFEKQYLRSRKTSSKIVFGRTVSV